MFLYKFIICYALGFWLKIRGDYIKNRLKMVVYTEPFHHVFGMFLRSIGENYFAAF